MKVSPTSGGRDARATRPTSSRRPVRDKMRAIYLILALLFTPATVLAQEDITGLYAAVTETEAVIELNLKKDNTK